VYKITTLPGGISPFAASQAFTSSQEAIIGVVRGLLADVDHDHRTINSWRKLVSRTRAFDKRVRRLQCVPLCSPMLKRLMKYPSSHTIPPDLKCRLPGQIDAGGERLGQVNYFQSWATARIWAFRGGFGAEEKAASVNPAADAMSSDTGRVNNSR
jgi:hypothetical protein